MQGKLSISLIRSLVLVAIFLVLQIIVSSIIMWLFDVSSVERLPVSNLFGVISIGVTQFVLMLLVVILTKTYSMRMSDYLTIRTIDYKICIFIVFLALSFQVLGSELENLSAEIFGKEKAYYALIHSVATLPGLNGAMYAFLLIVLAPAVVEELFFRGIIQQGLTGRYSKTVGILISSALFTAVHFNVNYIVPIFLLSVVLGYLYARYKNLLYCMGLHLFTNLAVLLLIRNKAFGLKGFVSISTVEHIDISIVIIALIVFFSVGYYVLFGKSRLE